MYQPTTVVGVARDAAGPALEWAAAHAGATGGHLVICHICPVTSPLARLGDNPPLATVGLAEPALARAVARVRDRLGGPRVTLSITTGHSGQPLLRAAARADLLVVGRSRSHAGPGSMAGHLVGRAHCPVVVVRPVTGGARGPFAGAVVVGVDGSAAARTALEFGFGFAATHHRVLVGVHVASHASTDVWFDQTTLETHLADRPAGSELLAGELEGWHLKYPEVPLRSALYCGRPLDGLLRAGRGAALLVVGGHRPGRPAPVTHRLLNRYDGPIAVTPTDPEGGYAP